MQVNAAARLAVAWLTMFLVGTELFVFSPLLPVLAARLPHRSGIGGAVGDDVFVSVYGERSVVRIFLGPDRAPESSDLFLARLRPRQYSHRRRRKSAGPARGQAFCRHRQRVFRRRSTHSSAAPRRQTAGPPGWRWWSPVCWSRLLSVRRQGAWRASSSAVHRYSLRSPPSPWCWFG
jgi:hypothetical protein